MANGLNALSPRQTLPAMAVMPVLGMIPSFLTDAAAIPNLELNGAVVLTMLTMTVSAAVLAHVRDSVAQETLSSSLSLFDNIPNPVLATDGKDAIVYLNGAALHVLGLPLEKCVGQPIQSIVPGVSDTLISPIDENVTIMLDLSLPSGPIRRFQASITRRGADGRFVGHLFLLHDVTTLSEEVVAKQEAAFAAQEASRLSSEFLAVVSHEIRTPMQAVIGMTGLLLGTELTDEQRDYVETIHSSGDSMLSILNNVLDFSKIEAGQIELENKPFDPVAAIEDTLSIFAGQASMKNVELAFVLGDFVPPVVSGDLTRFRQVLNNLVGNAVKFTDEGEVAVLINGQMQNDRVLLHVRVRDSGIGIPPERMDRLFRNFSQVDASTARVYGGTGLGLAICKSLCEIMGGDVWVESHTGVGSTFNFTVLTEPVKATESSDIKDFRLDNRSALIVDDNQTSREMLTSILGSWGMNVEAVDSGDAALRALETNSKYEVVLIDRHMPVMDGEETVRRIRSMRIRPEPRMVMMLALTDSGTRTRAAELGLASVVVKPLKRSQLRGVMKNLFAISEPEDAVSADSRLHVQPRRIKSASVLLADDNRVGQRVTTALLRRLGYKADVAGSGQEVLDAINKQPYDIVLMDVYMPDMDGLVATRRIRADYPENKQPYIVALTASAVASDRQDCLNAGMNDYLSKPIAIKDLEAALQRAQAADGGDGDEEDS